MIEHAFTTGKWRPGRRAVALAAATALVATLAACGGDDASGGAVDTSAAPTDPGDDGTDTTGDGGDDVGARIRDVTGFDVETDQCAGEEIHVGAVLALTGPGSFHGTTMSRGLDLAADHVAAAGGPRFAIEYKDHKSGDAAAGQQAITELGEGGFVAKFASYVDNLGSMLSGTAEYEVFTFDGGGGTSVFGQGQPFFWGTRAITPNDPLPGLFAYIRDAHPDATTVGVVGWDIGEPSTSIVREDILAKIDAAGLEHNGLFEVTPVGSQDYSQVLPKITSNEPDVLIVGMYGQDIGSFINQAETAGIDAIVVGFEFTPDGINASKGTFEDGYTFAYDYFNAADPTNPWAELFVSEFEETYGEAPDFYAANYYEDMFALWELVRRVCSAGEDVTGATLDAALRENPTFISVYGGDASGPGSKTLDLETHTVTERTMGVFRYEDGEVAALAYFGLDGVDYQIVD